MVMTLEMLERVLNSEIENLHIRVDEIVALARSLDTRLSSVERQLGLLTLSVEDLRVELRGNYLTKDEFTAVASTLASKEDLRTFATKEDLKGFATKDDVGAFITKDDARAFATKDDLKAFATKEDLRNMLQPLIKKLSEAIWAQA